MLLVLEGGVGLGVGLGVGTGAGGAFGRCSWLFFISLYKVSKSAHNFDDIAFMYKVLIAALARISELYFDSFSNYL